MLRNINGIYNQTAWTLSFHGFKFTQRSLHFFLLFCHSYPSWYWHFDPKATSVNLRSSTTTVLARLSSSSTVASTRLVLSLPASTSSPPRSRSGSTCCSLPVRSVSSFWCVRLVQFQTLLFTRSQTTSSGILDHEEARRKNIGGKILGYVY